MADVYIDANFITKILPHLKNNTHILLNGIEVTYNLSDGSVSSATETKSGGVTNINSPIIREAIEWQIRCAIALYAKAELLNELLKLNDQKIQNIIQSRHGSDCNENLSEDIIRHTLAKIIFEIKPPFQFNLFSVKSAPTTIQLRIHDALKEHGIDNILTLNDTKKIMSAINDESIKYKKTGP